MCVREREKYIVDTEREGGGGGGGNVKRKKGIGRV